MDLDKLDQRLVELVETRRPDGSRKLDRRISTSSIDRS